MKIFLDTANIEDIKKYNDMGLLDGITTNPSLLAKEGYTNVSNYSPGMNEWIKEGQAVVS